MTRSKKLDRRTALKGFGTVLALPLLDAMLPRAARAAAVEEAPRRLAFFFVPNGVHMPDWTPNGEGRDFELPAILSELSEYRDDLLVVSGLAHDKARANGDGPGDHARCAATFLTGCQAYKTAGKDIRVGVSVDQIAAAEVGHLTRFPSLELGCDKGAQSGNCDSGYSCAYSSNISWRTPNMPLAKEVDPQHVFDRLFAGVRRSEVAEARDRRLRDQKSVLDFVLDDAERLHKRLGTTDQRKLDEYLTSIREIERRVAGNGDGDDDPTSDLARPVGVPKDYAQHIRLMFDLLVVALQGDQTRIATFMFANAGSNRSYRFIEVPDGHHDLSHHGGDEEKQAKISKINRFHMSQFAYLLGRLSAIEEGDGSLLDNSMLVYGSGIGDGNRHNHDNLPILLAGRGGDALSTGRHMRLEENTPLSNLYLSLLERMGVAAESVGDSSGPLEGLDG